MTAGDEHRLRCQLDAMRLARAEDAKLCARLEARVKQLEAEVARLRHRPPPAGQWSEVVAAVRRLAPKWSYADDCDHKRASCEEIGCHGQIFRAYERALREPEQLAEGTRDETARRCTRCNCPVDPSEPAAVTFCRVCILAVAAEAVR